jgi:hypothetical protein
LKILNPYGDLFELLKDEPDELRLAARKKLIWAYSWAVPNDQALQTLAEFRAVIELGAGTGYWAWVASQAGANITALDKHPESAPHWVEVKEGGAQDLSSFSDHALMLCWPPYHEPMALDALHAYSGQTVIYIGEWRGRTADERFHDELEAHFVQKIKIPLLQWPGFRDEMIVFNKS